jgi:hypothetical protein
MSHFHSFLTKYGASRALHLISTRANHDRQDHKLRTALQDYENEKWRIVANKVGTGFTPAACRERYEQLFVGVPPTIEPILTSPPTSSAAGGDAVYSQQLR